MLKLGVIGAGSVVQGAHAPALADREDVQVTAIADPVEDNRKQLGSLVGCDSLYADYQTLLVEADVDAVFICLPHFLHEPATLAAFNAGVDVLLEKPIAMTLEEADRMIATAAEKGRRFYVSLNQRFYAAHRAVKEQVASGEHGRPFLALGHIIGDEFARMNIEGNWKGRWDQAGGGALMDTGTHIIDLMLWWFGRPRTVSCQHGRYLVEPDNKGDDNVVVNLAYDHMLVDIVVSYTGLADGWSEEKKVFFPKASLHVSSGAENPLLIGRGKAPLAPLEVDPMQMWFGATQRAALNHFLDCLQGKAEPEYGPEAARAALEVVLAAYQSAREEKTVHLD